MLGQSRISSLLPFLALHSSTFLLVSSTPFPTGEATPIGRNATERRTTPLGKRADTVQPGQPRNTVADQYIGGFQVVGNSGVTAQQLFLGNDHLVYIIDKVEANPLTINGHNAWATVYNLETNQAEPLDIVTNTFCAGGAELGDGRWLNVGGNKAVNPGGVDSESQTGDNFFQNSDGRTAARTILPADGATWSDNPQFALLSERWYPSLITLPDGRVFIMGGDKNGGFVNDIEQNNPTYSFWPPAEGESEIRSPLLENTLPANLYPMTHLLPDGRILVTANRKSVLLTYQTGEEQALPDVPHAVRTYPASSSAVMLPIKKNGADGWSTSVMYCGGNDLADDDWKREGLKLIDVQAVKSCVKMSFGENGPIGASDQWTEEDDLPEGRVMGNGILLPDGTVLIVNGAGRGVAGYADPSQQSWSNDDSLADDPLLTPVIYDPSKPSGQRWSRAGLKASGIARMYHSTATLLPDGSVFIAGSNPHADYTTDKHFPTEYNVEIFYPLYYNKRRPEPSGLPLGLTYGGPYFDVQLSKQDLVENSSDQNALNSVKGVKVVVMKMGFSTHGLNFGMRSLELEYTYSMTQDGGAILHVSQAPPNPALLPPGNAWLFVVVNGVPSVGVQIMVGSGNIETQTTLDAAVLPASSDAPTADVPTTTRSAASSAPHLSPSTTLFFTMMSALLIAFVSS
ncbi:DUF1929-domain-containing protein [Serendipita vermifera]|nr:DUF1929-domain-containing protein [Serendipita vermifera]